MIDVAGRQLVVTMPMVAVEILLLSTACMSAPLVSLLLTQNARNLGLLYACSVRYQWSLGEGIFLSVLYRNDPGNAVNPHHHDAVSCFENLRPCSNPCRLEFWSWSATMALILTTGTGHVIGAFGIARANTALALTSTVVVYASTLVLVAGNIYRCAQEGLRMYRSRHVRTPRAPGKPTAASLARLPPPSGREMVPSVASGNGHNGGGSSDAGGPGAGVAAAEEEQSLLPLGSNALVLFCASVLAAGHLYAAFAVSANNT